jgi:hypothetical protein
MKTLDSATSDLMPSTNDFQKPMTIHLRTTTLPLASPSHALLCSLKTLPQEVAYAR